jgi:DNA-directed RNA polymerase specialized sigma24 family protein
MHSDFQSYCSPNQAFLPVLSLDEIVGAMGGEVDNLLPCSTEPTPEEFVVCQGMGEIVSRFLATVSQQDRSIFERLVFDEAPQAMVAKELGISPSAICKRIAGLRMNLRSFHPIFVH